MQDGTKIKALVSTRSYQREGTIQGHLERARQRVAEMGDPRNDESNPKAKQAQARARREQQERLESALVELVKLQENKKGEQAKSKTRVSSSDPQARVMHHSDGGLALSYNAQISTDAAHGLVVGVAVTQAAEDSAQLLPAVDRVEQRLKKKPRQMVADDSYTTRENIEKMAGREVDFVGSMGREEMPSGATVPNRLPPSAFLYQPKRIVIYVQKASCCDRKGVSTTRTSEVSWLIATRLESATARLASANPSAAQKTRAAAVDCYGEWRIPQFWRFEKRWPLQ
jgi:hypothetical protein